MRTPSFAGFRSFFEDEVRSLEGGDKPAGKPENMIDAMKRVLGVNPDDLPDDIPSGPITIDGVSYNQAVWELHKPIRDTDRVVRIRMKSPEELNSPSLNQVAVKDGKMYGGKTPQNWMVIPIEKLAEMLGRPMRPPPGGGGMGGGMPPMPGM